MAVISGGTTLIDNGTLDAAVPTGKMTLLATQTASASATISFTSGIDSTYDSYVFKFYNIHPASASLFSFQGSIDSGSNYNLAMTTTTFDAYHNEADTGTSLRYTTGYDQAQGTAFQSITDDNFTPADDESGNGYLHLFNPSSTTFVKHYLSCTAHIGNGYGLNTFSAGYFNTTSAIDAIQFKMSSGNIDSGVIKLYGIGG
jgi:hypothetical protein